MAYSVNRVQTAFRLPVSLLERLKRQAQREGRSLNSYVERILEEEVALDFPRLPKDYVISEEIKSMHCIELKEPTPEEMEADPKLAYLWKKHVKTY